MRILIDGDSCPADRRIFLQRAITQGIEVVFALNMDINPKNLPIPVVRCTNVDAYLLHTATRGDIVITRDLPLAQKCIRRGLRVLDFCGREIDGSYIATRVAHQQHHSYYHNPAIKRGSLTECRPHFANALDKIICHHTQRQTQRKEARAPAGDGT